MRRNLEKNEAIHFWVEKLTDVDRDLHFHPYPEIYCVVSGSAFVAVFGDNRLLSQGQMVVISPYENHSCEVTADGDVLVIRIGADDLHRFSSVYPDKKLPRWLTNAETNRAIYEYIGQNLEQATEGEADLLNNSFACQLLSLVVEGYGLLEQKGISHQDQALIAEIVQYIYDHCSEKISLEILAKKFYLSPTFLSKKLKKQICVDFRVFVNDLRIHKAIRMMASPEGRGEKMEAIAIACGFRSMSTFYRCYKRNDNFRKIRAAEETL